jgi:hypothetical protein
MERENLRLECAKLAADLFQPRTPEQLEKFADAIWRWLCG